MIKSWKQSVHQRRLDKHLVCSYGILLNNKKNELLTQTTTWMTLKHITLNKRSQTQESILYGSIYMSSRTGKTNPWR